MRIVLDTNILVSGLLRPHGPPGRVLDLVLAGSVSVLWDDRLLAEYAEVLARPKPAFSVGDARAALDYLRLAGEFIHAQPLPLSPRARPPDAYDVPFAAVALAGKADALVTGNPRHFAFLTNTELNVCTPAVFLTRWQTQA
jgi:putative PIN family toxin of toxin-antitoxin system